MFESHCQFLLNNFLNPWAKKYLSLSINNSYNKNNDLCGLIIDDRPNEILRFSVLNTLLMTNLKLPIKIYTTKKSLLNTTKLFSDFIDHTQLIEIVTLETNKINIRFYNNLLKSLDLWADLTASKILVFQTDSLIIEPMEYSMFDFDYIGALFCKGKSRCIRFPLFNKESQKEIGSTWINQIYNADLIPEVLMGNGGLSIRSRKIMMRICSNETSEPNENEDIFFSRYIRKYSQNIPGNTKIINRFSIEADFHNSIGYHGSHFYLDHSELSSIYDRHIKNVIGLISLY